MNTIECARCGLRLDDNTVFRITALVVAIAFVNPAIPSKEYPLCAKCGLELAEFIFGDTLTNDPAYLAQKDQALAALRDGERRHGGDDSL